MRIGQAAGFVFFSAVICSAALAAPATRQSDGLLGVLKSDGSFRPTMLRHDGTPSTSTTVSGKLVLKLAITIQSVLPPNTPVQCSLNAEVSGVADSGQEDVVEDTVQGIATGSGTSATCLLTMPYKWHLFADSGGAIVPDSVILSYSITALNGAVGRVQSSTFDTIAVPDNGKTTAYNEDARI